LLPAGAAAALEPQAKSGRLAARACRSLLVPIEAASLACVLALTPFADLQTSIMAVAYDGGVIMGADSRTTMGSYIVSGRARWVELDSSSGEAAAGCCAE
jgi:20S proteasome alpha/beta subunit